MLVKTRGGTVAWYEIGRGAPVLLVHGLGEDHRAWRRVVPSLMLERRVILYDIRGHGSSPVGRGNGTLSQLGDDLFGLLDALQIERLPVVGFSLGGLISVRCVIDHPERIAALALTSTSPEVGPSAAEWYRRRARIGLARDEALRGIMGEDVKALFRRRHDLAEGFRIRMESTADLRGYGNACAALAALHMAPITDELQRLSVPTLVLAGANDDHTDTRMPAIFLDSIPDAQLHSIADAGYAVPVERGPQMAKTLLSWLARLGL